MIEAFHTAYKMRNGHRLDAMDVQAVTFRVELVMPTPKFEHEAPQAAKSASRAVERGVIRHLYGQERQALHYERDALAPNDVVEGPAVIHEELSTTFVPLGRTAIVGRLGELVIA
jgi:N-methylhydantoinase A